MMENIGAYIHIPFCRQKCLYCDFLSYNMSGYSAEEYVKAVLNEIKREQNRNYNIKTIFIGGGTPSVIASDYIYDILNCIYQNFSIDPKAEISIEGNPESLTADKLCNYAAFGINRLSIGLQAWQDSLLNTIGRIHTQQDFIKAYNAARRAGFENINIDLMFSLPGQTLEQWQETLKNVFSMAPEHISAYSLTIEEGTPFYEMTKNKKIKQTSDEFDRILYCKAKELLAAEGYMRYEISNFSRAGFDCRHNLNYWRRGAYYGFGIGASSFMKNVRFCNTSSYTAYIAGSPYIEQEIVTGKSAYSEYMFLGLRLADGININTFQRQFGVSYYDIYCDETKKLDKLGLIKIDGDNICLTDKGIDVSNQVFMEFI